MTIPTDLIDLRTASQISGRSRTTLKERIHAGRLPAWREGKEYFVSRAHVEALFRRVVPPRQMMREELKAIYDSVVAKHLPHISSERRATSYRRRMERPLKIPEEG